MDYISNLGIYDTNDTCSQHIKTIEPEVGLYGENAQGSIATSCAPKVTLNVIRKLLESLTKKAA